MSFHKDVLVSNNTWAEIWGNENTAKENICDNPGGNTFENLMLDVKVEFINETSHEEVLLSNCSRNQNKYSKKKLQKEKSRTYKNGQNPTEIHKK